MLGVTGRPTPVDDMILPPSSHDMKVISSGCSRMATRRMVWRGPMLHRALQQFLADVFWGDLDLLLLDLPPGTGDIAISLAQLMPYAELIVVDAAARGGRGRRTGGRIVAQTRQQITGVMENMSYLCCPHSESRWTCSGRAAARRSPPH